MADNPRDLAEYQSDHDLLVILNERVGALTVAVSKKSDDHEGRLRLLEQRQWTIGGAASAVGIIAGYLWSLFT